MVDRTTFSGGSAPPVAGPDFLDQYAERIDTLFDASALPLTGVGGTANAVTATLDPPLAVAGTFVDGMKFTLTWAAANTAGVTLAINGGAALPVLGPDGAALVAGSIASGLRSLIEFTAGSFRVLSPIIDGASETSFYWAFTASGTWNKPAGLDPNRMVIVELWGGGGGGASASPGGGGGGGGYRRLRLRLSDLPSSVSVTIGAGGGVGGGGGNTTFGALGTAFGGGGSTGPSGGGGGGAFGAGGTGNPGGGGRLGGGAGVATARGDDGVGFGGGGGGSSQAAPTNTGFRGGDAVYGGGGGGGVGSSGAGAASGGLSVRGGNGGDANAAGLAPGGGGGRNAAGARGEVRVWI